MNRSKIAILCTELTTMRSLTDTLSRQFDCIWSRDAKALQNDVQANPDLTAVLVDIAAVPSQAIELLQFVKETCPVVRRVLITDYCDLRIIIQGLHTGAVQNIVYKPIYAPELLGGIGSAPITAPASGGARAVFRAARVAS